MLLDACVLSPDGAECIRRSDAHPCTSVNEANQLGKKLAQNLFDAGADRILRLMGRSVANG
jgi:hypothetical protein